MQAYLPQVGDIMVAQNKFALARKIRINAVMYSNEGNPHREKLVADVIEGEDTKKPLTVFRLGWDLYRKE